MFGMDEGLQLSNPRTAPFTKSVGIGHGLPGDTSQKMFLTVQRFCLQSCRFTSRSDLGEVDVSGEVLFAWVRENVLRQTMLPVTAKRAVCSVGSQEFLRQKPVIQGQ